MTPEKIQVASPEVTAIHADDKSLSIKEAVVEVDSAGVVFDDHSQFFDRFSFDEKISATFHGRCIDPRRLRTFTWACVGSLGLVSLLAKWVPRVRAWAISRSCPLAAADHVLVVNSFGQVDFVELRRVPLPLGFSLQTVLHPPAATSSSAGKSCDGDALTVMDYRCNRFVLDPLTGTFCPCEEVAQAVPQAGDIRTAQENGVPMRMLPRQRLVFGPNIIDIGEETVLQSLFNVVLHPFNLFQLAGVVIWSSQNYYAYAAAILVITAYSTVVTLWENRDNQKRMRAIARFVTTVTVRRAGSWQRISSEDLVPGDLVLLEDDSSSASDSLPSPSAAPLSESSPNGNVLSFDGVILCGDALVDESLLTGESVPVLKDAVASQERFTAIVSRRLLRQQAAPEEAGDGTVTPLMPTTESVSSGHRGARLAASLSSTASILQCRHSLFAGTRLVRVRGRPGGRPAVALCLATGFTTLKGSLVQSILFPRPNNFRFYRDTAWFIACLAVIAACGFAFSVYWLVRIGAKPFFIVTKALDLITVAVPPALHTTITLGTIFAMGRLRRRHQLYCISPPRINVAAKVSIACFDKTGTLTEDGLVVHGVLPCSDSCFAREMVRSRAGGNGSGSGSASSGPLTNVMAACHSVQRVRRVGLVGDPLDLQMFSWSGWHLLDHPSTADSASSSSSAEDMVVVSGDASLTVLRSFDFSPALRRMSVVVRARTHPPTSFTKASDRKAVPSDGDGDDSLVVMSKGSPESIARICRSESLPPDYHAVLARYASAGYRVIACASKSIPASSDVESLSRDQDVERDLAFVGFVVFENPLKAQSAPVIAELHDAGIATCMCTGDNVLTAVSVARACGIVPRDALVFVPHLVYAPQGGEYVDGGHANGGCAKDGDDAASAPSSSSNSGSNASQRKQKPRRSPIEAVQWECVDATASYALDPLSLATSAFTERPVVLACTGDVFDHVVLLSAAEGAAMARWMRRFFARCRVFARMSPSQKQVLVELMQAQAQDGEHPCVAFCGDGANDCGALRAADVGVSLSQAEASVAAPFTSKIADIRCVPNLIREGRASLVTSFSAFIAMAMYSMVQFTSLLFLYPNGSNLSDYQFMFIDMALILPLGYLMTRFDTARRLVREAPEARLVSASVLTRLFGQTLLQGAVQGIAYYATTRYAPIRVPQLNPASRLIPRIDPDNSNTSTPINTSLFYLSNFLYLTLTLLACGTRPHRRALYWPFHGGLVLCALVSLAFARNRVKKAFGVDALAGWGHWVFDRFELTPICAQNHMVARNHRLLLLYLAAAHFILAVLGEWLLFPAIARAVARPAKKKAADEEEAGAF